jgi:hypothetical protein
MHGLFVIPTPKGRQVADGMRAAIATRRTRERACAAALVSWLDSRDAIGPSRAVSIDGFFTDNRARYYGQLFTLLDVEHAAEWLEEQDLIGGEHAAEFAGPIQPYLTSKGEDCLERFDGDVKQYVLAMSAGTGGSGGVNWNISFGSNSGNVQIAGGDNARQTISAGPQPDELQQVIHGIADIVHALGYGEDSEELREATEDAISEAAAPQPEAPKARRFRDVVLRVLAAGALPPVTAAVNAASTGVINEIEHLGRLAIGG